MMRFCPNCKTERSVQEWYCEGTAAGAPCQWDLSAIPIREPGSRPQAIVTAESTERAITDADADAGTGTGTGTGTTGISLACSNGHPMNDGDLMCLVCGADPAIAAGDATHPGDTRGDASADQPASETQIDGWRLIRQISSSDSTRERYIAQHRDDNRQAVLTLYRDGAEPDPSVYEVVRRLPREHVPEIIATGRWEGRAYEVADRKSVV